MKISAALSTRECNRCGRCSRHRCASLGNNRQAPRASACTSVVLLAKACRLKPARRRKEWNLMWIVRLALRRPYTFVVCAMLVMILGIYQILNTPTDIFPNINIPVISVAFNYTGMPADEMEKRITGQFERILTTTVNDIEHIESQSLTGIGITKIYFQKGANVDAAVSQVTAV